MRVALVCCGLEHIQRGFESFSRELFDNFRDTQITIHLYKGSGKKAIKEFVMPCIKRNSTFLNFLPRSNKGIYYKYRIECYSFALLMLPALFKHKYDLIHCSDNEFGRALLKFRKLFGFRYRILFSNGAPWTGAECKIFDAVQEVTKAMQEQNIQEGVKAENSWYVPYGLAANQYNLDGFDKDAIRKKYNVPDKAFVILSLSALKITHKRLDWLIKEYAKLTGNYFLIMAGGKDEETEQVKKLASASLQPASYCFTTVPYSEVVKLLAISDVMVSTSLSEAFGRVLLEATAAKVPVLAHPHYAAKEIIAHPASLVNMDKSGELAQTITQLHHDASLKAAITEKNYNYCITYFDWKALNSAYKKMYQGVIDKTGGNEN